MRTPQAVAAPRPTLLSGTSSLNSVVARLPSPPSDRASACDRNRGDAWHQLVELVVDDAAAVFHPASTLVDGRDLHEEQHLDVPSAQSMGYHQHMPEAGDCLLAEGDLNVRHRQDKVQGIRR